jgi:large subunit ribosomal protein L15
MRIPKLKGFRNPNKEPFAIVNLAALNVFTPGSTVTPDDLHRLGLIKHHGRIKVLAEGEVEHRLEVRAHAFSATAKAKIEAAGGTAELID